MATMGPVEQHKKELCKQAYLLIHKYLAAAGKEGQVSSWSAGVFGAVKPQVVGALGACTADTRLCALAVGQIGAGMEKPRVDSLV